MSPSPLFSVSPWLLVAGALVGFIGVAVLVRLVGERVVTEDRRPALLSVVGPLTPALAALFAVMTAFTVVTEAGYLRSAQTAATNEASAASRLAWASTNAGVDTDAVQRALAGYVRVTTGTEWTETYEHQPTAPPMVRALRRLEAATRTEALRPGVPSAVASELLAALDGVTVARRDRISEASRSIPMGYLLVLVVAGLALVVNVALLTLAGRRRGLLLVGGIVTVVALVLALLVAISAPFAGALVVDHAGLDRVLIDLGNGLFTPLR